MKKIGIAVLVLACLLLGGCGWLDGSYVSVTPHREPRPAPQPDAVSVSDYQELIEALRQIVAAGQESAVIHVAEYPPDAVQTGVEVAVRHIKTSDPVGAYAVEELQCELGTNGSVPALAVNVRYRRSPAELARIRKLKDMQSTEKVVAEALENCDPGIVFLVEDYTVRDLTQFVQDYAYTNPQAVMEAPQVTENIYGSGHSRVVELIFTYQNSREDLRKMKSQVEPVYNAAVLYVSGEGADRQKLSQLYAFLMERFDYKIETSITPAYSLLRHGVGDSRAFATVYAAMCRGAELECLTVTGTCSGEPRTWNIVREGERYYHVDLLKCSELGLYRTCTDAEMEGYVWDYSAYPACTGTGAAPAPAENAGGETVPEKSAE